MAASARKSVAINCQIDTGSEIAKANIGTILEFFACYQVDKPGFYALWVDDEPEVITPFATDAVAVCRYTSHLGWDAVKAFWDPIHDEMSGQFDWTVEEVIFGADPDLIVTKTSSVIDVECGPAWGGGRVAYAGRYIQIFKFASGRIKSFEEYYDTATLNAAYSA